MRSALAGLFLNGKQQIRLFVPEDVVVTDSGFAKQFDEFGPNGAVTSFILHFTTGFEFHFKCTFHSFEVLLVKVTGAPRGSGLQIRFCLFSLVAKDHSDQWFGKCSKYQHDQTDDQYGDGFSVTAFPLLEDDSPDVAEYDVESHQDTERQGHERLGRGEESLTDRKSEKLAVPQSTGQEAEQCIVGPNIGLFVVAPCVVLLILIEAVDGIGNKTTQRDEERSGKGLENFGRIGEGDAFTELQTTLKQPLMKPANRAIVIPFGKLKSLTAAFFSSSESEADFIEPAIPIMAIPISVITTPAITDARKLREGVQFGEEDVEQHRSQDGSQTGACAERDALSKCNAPDSASTIRR